MSSMHGIAPEHLTRYCRQRQEGVLDQCTRKLSGWTEAWQQPNVVAQFKAVVCVPGHGRRIDDIIGVNVEGKVEPTEKNVHRDYAVQVVRQGLAAVAIEQMAFG